MTDPSGRYSHYTRTARERIERVLEKLAEILVSNNMEWRDEVDAYWLLRKFENEVNYPVTYDLVEEAVERARRQYRLVVLGKEVAEEAA